MKINLTSVLVDDQKKALKFYTEKLGFEKKTEIDMGDFLWLTVIAPDGHSDVELVLEPNANVAARSYQATLFEQGIPFTSFASSDVSKEYEKLRELGVEFKSEPQDIGPTKIAVFQDTCGNWIQIHQA